MFNKSQAHKLNMPEGKFIDIIVLILMGKKANVSKLNWAVDNTMVFLLHSAIEH